MRGEQSKYGAGNLLRIDAGVAMHAVVDPIKNALREKLVWVGRYAFLGATPC